MELISTGLSQNSPPLIQQGLDRFAHSPRGLTPALRDRVLGLAVKKGKPDVVRYLIDEAGCEVGRVRAESVGGAVREMEMEKGGDAGKGKEGEGGVGVEDVIGVLEVLVERGWDVNGGLGDSPDPHHPSYLIYQVISSPPLVHWCLTHGAHTTYPTLEPHTPLLSHIASSSPPATAPTSKMAVFKLLLEHGAKMGRRTLHMAVVSAARGAEGNMDLVRFLVEEMGCDVNAMDVPEGERYGNRYGTPINYVAHGRGDGSEGEEMVVRYLLEKGANPEIKDCWDLCDAFGYAKLGNKKVLEVLNQWKQENQKRGLKKHENMDME